MKPKQKKKKYCKVCGCEIKYGLHFKPIPKKKTEPIEKKINKIVHKIAQCNSKQCITCDEYSKKIISLIKES